ncbi:MAG: chromosomal replication initiator protein DnaA [Pseudomonadota bacterium]
MTDRLWTQVSRRLQEELSSDDLQLWVEPVQGRQVGRELILYAPNNYIARHLEDRFGERIGMLVDRLGGDGLSIRYVVGSAEAEIQQSGRGAIGAAATEPEAVDRGTGNVDPRYHFENFVQGKSNQLARAAAMQVGENPGDSAYNPLLFYGGTGLGKTHLLHATGNRLRTDHGSRVVYLHSEQFVSQMIMALRHNTIDQFKAKYRSVDALMIDDIQFFAGKDRTQEEFFHTFNTLLEGQQQIILTCDRYPKEVDGLEARLKSRFGWGLSVAIEPPDFETRVAILLSKAAGLGMALDAEVAYFIAKRIRSNVRDLEGALNTLCASARFTGAELTLEFARETLRDLLTVHERLITISNIQKVVAEYYKIRVAELLSKRRNRSIARPRQVAMALAKELTDHSLPEIGDAFGGRDHTTVLHACRKIAELKETDGRIREDYEKLLRELTT